MSIKYSVFFVLYSSEAVIIIPKILSILILLIVLLFVLKLLLSNPIAKLVDHQQEN